MPLAQEELEEIKQDYLDSLQDLTINSRPLIRDLTMIAQETLYAAQYIVKAIEEHINRVSSLLCCCLRINNVQIKLLMEL